MAERQPTLVTPFWVRIATEPNLSPGWLLIAFPAVLYPIYLALEAIFGRGKIVAKAMGVAYDPAVGLTEEARRQLAATSCVTRFR